MSTFTVGYFVGSLARASINRKLAVALTRVAPPQLQMREIPIGDLPLYSYDHDTDYPPPARSRRARGLPCCATTHIAIQEALDGRAVDRMEHVGDAQYQAHQER